MKYFKYCIWDNEQFKDRFVLPREISIYGLPIPFFGEIVDGKNYDLITGEEITYCAHPYLGRLSFIGYEMASPGEIKLILEKLSPADVKTYRDNIYRIKKQASKMGIKEYEKMYHMDEVYSEMDGYVKTFKKKNIKKQK